MAGNIISDALNSMKWTYPSRDDFNKINSDKPEPKDTAVRDKIMAGISGIGSGVPIIAPSNWAGVCVFSFQAEEIAASQEIKDDIKANPRVNGLTDCFDNFGVAAMIGFENACFFFADTDKQYMGGSIGTKYAFISAIAATEDYKYIPNAAVPSLTGTDPHIDIESSHILAMAGNEHGLAGLEYIKHDLNIDDADVSEREEWKARFEVNDLEKYFTHDTDFTLGIGGSANFKGEYSAHIDTGTLKITFKFDNNGHFRIEPFIQGGFSF